MPHKDIKKDRLDLANESYELRLIYTGLTHIFYSSLDGCYSIYKMKLV